MVAISKPLSSHVSATIRPTDMKFGKVKNIPAMNLVMPAHTPHLVFCLIENAKIINWLQFLFAVKATALKQQISKFYMQVLSTEASFYI